MREMVGGCCVCADESGWHENPLVYCDGCDLAVHQGCYGIINVPEGNWYCSKCQDLHKPIPDAQCKLCPLPYGALKRTEDDGWAHVICALYIPEIKFGDVNSMDPVITSEVPLDSFSRVCYICLESGRLEAAKSGVCVRCHRDNCKRYFHVTCAQWSGLLCEEHGGQKCVRYIGFCAYHYKKVAQTDPNIKCIPPYRPANGTAFCVLDNNKSSKPDPAKLTNGPGRPASSADNRPSSTLDTRPPSTASTHSLASSNPARPSSQSRPASVSAPKNTWDIGRLGSLPPPANLIMTTKQNGPGGWTEARLPPTSGAVSLLVPSSTAPMSHISPISPPLPTKPVVSQVSLMPTSMALSYDPGIVVKPDPGSGLLDSTTFPLPHATQLTSSLASNKTVGRPPGTGKRGRPPNHAGVDPCGPGRPPKKPRKNTSKKTVKSLLEEVSQVVDDTVTSFQRERELSHQAAMATTSCESLLNPVNQSIPGLTSLDLTSMPMSLPPTNHQSHPNDDTSLPAFAQLAEGSALNMGPVRPVPMLGSVTSDQPCSSSSSVGIVFPGTLEQLLERQWEQGSQFLMDQAKHFDVASMLSCLHSLREENQRMDGDVAGLTSRRDHLLAVNARLGVTLAGQHSPNRALPSHIQSNDSSPSSVVAGYRAPSTISPASQGSNSKCAMAQPASAMVSPLTTVASVTSTPQVLPASYGAFTSVNAQRHVVKQVQPSIETSTGFLMPRAPDSTLLSAAVGHSLSQLTQEQLLYFMTHQAAYGGLGLVMPPNTKS